MKNVAYSALLGGLSSGIFELSSSISTNNQNSKLNPNEVIEGIWEDSPNKSKNKPNIIDDAVTTLKIPLGFVDDSGQLTFIPTKAIITDTKVIAGNDVKNEFRDAKKYVDKYGGKENDYYKVVGKIESAKYIFDIHFVKDKAGKEYDFKIKSKTLKREKHDR